MTENIENQIIEHLRAIRGDVANIKPDMREVRMRLTSIDERLTLVEKGVANVHGDLVIVQTRLDRQEKGQEGTTPQLTGKHKK